MAWLTSAGRWRRERERRARIATHSAAPVVLDEDERGWVIEPFGDAVTDPMEAVLGWFGGVFQRRMASRHALLEAAIDDVAPRRGLRRIGIKRSRIDRWLAEEIPIETAVGPSLGGVRAGWLRVQAGRAGALRWDRARPEGWLAVDLAALTLDAMDEHQARQRHAARAQDPVAADRAFELAQIAVLLREHAITKNEAIAARVRQLVGVAANPSLVRVWIEGPSIVPPDLWHHPGEAVSAARARWLQAHLDGLSVGGSALRVRTHPALIAGRRVPRREPRTERRRRLFSRWHDGVRVDDEGLTSATPEALAMRIAEGARGVVLDGTCGVGALTIALARQPEVERVIAVDLDPDRLAMARHNARLYGVADRIEWIAGDVLDVLTSRRADLLVLDPPWGGRGYDRGRMELDDLPMDLRAAFARFGGPIALKLPRSFDPVTLPGGPWRVEPLVDDRGILKMLLARRDV